MLIMCLVYSINIFNIFIVFESEIYANVFWEIISGIKEKLSIKKIIFVNFLNHLLCDSNILFSLHWRPYIKLYFEKEKTIVAEILKSSNTSILPFIKLNFKKWEFYSLQAHFLTFVHLIRNKTEISFSNGDKQATFLCLLIFWGILA